MRDSIVVLSLLALACSGSSKKTDPGPSDTPDVADVATEEEGPPDMGWDLQAPEGCPAYTSPPGGGIAQVLISPEDIVLEVPLGKTATVQFKATIVYMTGEKAELPGGDFKLTEPGVGEITKVGLFTSVAKTGGETYVTLTAAGACGAAHLRVVQVLADKGTSGIENPGDLVKQISDPQEAPDIELLYPPDNAMAPADFPPITVQYLAPSPGDVGIVRFEATGARLDLLFDPAKAKKDEGYTVPLASEFFASLFGINGAGTYSVSVLAVPASGGKVTGKVLASKGRKFSVTEFKAGGAFYYWNTGGIAGNIHYLELGKEKPAGVKLPVSGCVGCHSVSPDATVVGVSPFIGAGFSSFNLVLGDLVTGKEPDWVHADAKKQMGNPMTIAPAFSPMYWKETDKRIVVPSGQGMLPGNAKLYHIDLLKGVVSPLVKGGDAGQPAFPAWSPDGGTVVYTSAKNGSPFAITGPCQLYRVPYNNGAGGKAEPLQGASDGGVLQFYPVFSPDGLWIAFNRAEDDGLGCPQSGSSSGAAQSGGTYDNCKADVYMVQQSGGQAIRLATANGEGSPGLTNSWPTFGITLGKYYWIAFSSRRDYGFMHKSTPASQATPQIWVAAVDPELLMQGLDGSFAALWLPFQEMDSGNHIARWGEPIREDKPK